MLLNPKFILFLLLAFAACKKRDFLEPPQPNLSRFTATDPQTIALAQNWFKHQKETFALRTEQKSTQREQIVDSLPWLPQWDLAKSYSLGNSKTLVLMPIWRYKNVIYNPDYGFMRRLKLIVSAQNRIEYGAITEVIALSKHDLQSQGDDIIYQSCMRNLPQGYFVYDLALDNPFFTRRAEERPESEGVCMELGQSDAGDMCVTYLLCTTNYIDFFFDLSISPSPCPRSTEDPQSGGNGSSSSGSGNGFPPPNVPSPPINNIPMPGTGGSGPSTGGGGGGSIGGIYVGGTLPSDLGGPRAPIYSTPPSNSSFLIDYGDNANPNQPYEPSALLKSFTQQKSDGSYDFGTLTPAEIRKLDETILLLQSNSPLMAKVFEELASHKLAWGAFSDANSGVNAQYTSGDKTIKFNRARGDDEALVPKKPYSLLEELLHALQHKFYGANFKNIPLSNIELEAKFIRDLIHKNASGYYGYDYHFANDLFDREATAIPDGIENTRYKKYLRDIIQFIGPPSDTSPPLPQTMTDLNVVVDGQNVSYWNIMDDFRNYWSIRNPSYAVTPDTSQQPTLLFWLANNCNCNHRIHFRQ